MIRLALVVAAVYLFCGTLNVRRRVRAGAPATGGGAGEAPRGAGGAPQAEMIRDPVCGTWIDRRLAVFGRRGNETVPVCSDGCRRRLEAG